MCWQVWKGAAWACAPSASACPAALAPQRLHGVLDGNTGGMPSNKGRCLARRAHRNGDDRVRRPAPRGLRGFTAGCLTRDALHDGFMYSFRGFTVCAMPIPQTVLVLVIGGSIPGMASALRSAAAMGDCRRPCILGMPAFYGISIRWNDSPRNSCRWNVIWTLTLSAPALMMTLPAWRKSFYENNCDTAMVPSEDPIAGQPKASMFATPSPISMPNDQYVLCDPPPNLRPISGAVLSRGRSLT